MYQALRANIQASMRAFSRMVRRARGAEKRLMRWCVLPAGYPTAVAAASD
jgi:hypothetical protein